MGFPAAAVGMAIGGSLLNAYGTKKGNDAQRGMTLEELRRQREFDARIGAEVDRLLEAQIFDPDMVGTRMGAADSAVAGVGGHTTSARRERRSGKRRAGVAAGLAGLKDSMSAHDLKSRGVAGNILIQRLLADNSMRALESETQQASRKGSVERTLGNTMSIGATLL